MAKALSLPGHTTGPLASEANAIHSGLLGENQVRDLPLNPDLRPFLALSGFGAHVQVV